MYWKLFGRRLNTKNMISNTAQRCDFRIHDIIDNKYRVERVLETSLNNQKFKVIDSEERNIY